MCDFCATILRDWDEEEMEIKFTTWMDDWDYKKEDFTTNEFYRSKNTYTLEERKDTRFGYDDE